MPGGSHSSTLLHSLTPRTAAVRPTPNLTMRHDRIRVNGLGGAFSILLLGLSVTTAQQVSLNRSAAEEVGWDLKSGEYTVSV